MRVGALRHMHTQATFLGPALLLYTTVVVGRFPAGSWPSTHANCVCSLRLTKSMAPSSFTACRCTLELTRRGLAVHVATYLRSTAAQRMVPESLHDTDSDWTVLLVPVAQLTGLAVRPLRHAHVLGRHASSALYGGAHLYILSYSRTVHDACAPRGGRLYAVALGTMHPYLDMFKVRAAAGSASSHSQRSSLLWTHTLQRATWALSSACSTKSTRFVWRRCRRLRTRKNLHRAATMCCGA